MMLSERETEMLRELADVRGVSNADVLRELLREEHKREFANNDSTMKKKPR